MKNVYAAYSKTVLGNNYFFIKKFISFPDLKNVPDVLESYGMHTDFDQACNIAKIDDQNVKQQLFKSIQESAESAKVIQMSAKIINAAQS